MKSKIIIIFIAIITGLSSVGCKKEEVKEELTVLEEVMEEETREKVEELVKKEGIPSPISGIYASPEKVNRRPVAIMFDNHPSARWQSGLKDAEIVYEFPVEAPYTRYMGIYLINDPKSIGSIRSSRPYFVTTVLEYDAVYVRVGGSEQAKSDIKTLKVADIDGLSSAAKVFWRKTHKKKPHNLYSSMDIIRETQEERGYKMAGEYKSFKFKEDESDIEGDVADKISINYRKDNKTLYNYDEENKIYKRTKDGELHIDESDQSEIIAKNIVIQEARIKTIDNEGRLEIVLIGEGMGKYITNGKVIDIKWVKNSRSDKTLYYNLNGEEILFNPGVTWIQIIGLNSDVIIE